MTCHLDRPLLRSELTMGISQLGPQYLCLNMRMGTRGLVWVYCRNYHTYMIWMVLQGLLQGSWYVSGRVRSPEKIPHLQIVLFWN
jgi:hypothetical protein